MKPFLSSSVLCRTPVFALDIERENSWDQLKEYIADSSPNFYELIKDYKTYSPE